jgi:hypothetical protein
MQQQLSDLGIICNACAARSLRPDTTLSFVAFNVHETIWTFGRSVSSPTKVIYEVQLIVPLKLT